jgi:hypothetical protein
MMACPASPAIRVPPRDPPMPPIPLGRTGTHYARAMNRLGWHWWPSDTMSPPPPMTDGRPASTSATGTGLRAGAKASTDITYWPPPSAPGWIRARVAGAKYHQRARHAAVIYYDADGSAFQPAEVVIVAATRRHAAPAAGFGLRRFPTGLPTRPAWSARTDAGIPGRSCPAASTRRWMAGAAHHLDVEQAVLRDRPARGSCAATISNQPRHRPGK